MRLSFATTWMNLEDILRSEISKIQKEECRMTSLICGNLKKLHTLKETVEE